MFKSHFLPAAPSHRRSSSAFILFALVGLGSSMALDRPEEAGATTLRHLALQSSVPEADATVGRLEEVRLFFTEAPQIEGTTIRIANAGNELIASTDTVADGEDPSQVFVRLNETLSAGAYTVHWRAIAQDGHALNGEYGFQVTTE